MATPTKEPTGNGSTALAKIDERTVCNVPQLRDVFQAKLSTIRDALPTAMKRNAERLARCALTEFQKNPELMKCTGLSILSCAVQAAQLGLEIGGVMGQCYMVPYGGRATFQIGYRGMIELAFRSGHVANVYASVVREKDKFRIMRGTTPGIEHEPATVNAGKVIGAYAVVVYTSKQINFEWMDRADIEHHRDTYSKTARSNSSPWATAFNEMAKKTVLRKLLKHCPFAADFPDEATPAPAPAPVVEGEIPPAIDPPADPTPAADFQPDESDNGVDEPSGRLFPAETDVKAIAK